MGETMPKMTHVSADNSSSNSAASASRRGGHSSEGRRRQVRRNDPTVSTPVMSPSHHVHQIKVRALAGLNPPRYRLATPRVEAIRHMSIATPANVKAWAACWKG